MDPPPPVISAGLLDKLGRTAFDFWRANVEDVGRRVVPDMRGPLAQAALGLDRDEFACAMLSWNPGWTNRQIADAVGCPRTSLYRCEKYVKLREIMKSAGMDLRARRGRAASEGRRPRAK